MSHPHQISDRDLLREVGLGNVTCGTPGYRLLGEPVAPETQARFKDLFSEGLITFADPSATVTPMVLTDDGREVL